MLVVGSLDLSIKQSRFMWHALHDPRDSFIAERMRITPHGAHAHRVAVFKKLNVDCMPAAITRVFAAYILLRDMQVGLTVVPRTTSLEGLP